jgi:hypothetical protein
MFEIVKRQHIRQVKQPSLREPALARSQERRICLASKNMLSAERLMTGLSLMIVSGF